MIRYSRILGTLLALALPAIAAAGDHTGQVMLGGVPVPGAVVTASRDAQRLSTSTDQSGRYRFTGIADGSWTVRVEMSGFAPLSRAITITAATSSQTWELGVLPFAELSRSAQILRADSPRTTAPAGRGAGPAREAAATPGAAPNAPRAAGTNGPPPLGGEAASPAASGNSLLVSGTVNNAASSTFSQNGALGNVARRPTGIQLFQGTVSTRLGSSALDSRPYSFTGRPAQRPDYRDVNFTATVNGPWRIPGLMRNTRTGTFTYNRTSNNQATTLSQQMPTFLQRLGDFSQSVDGFGQPVQIVDPLTGLPFEGNRIPVERLNAQALALLRYYPVADPAATGTYNYQVPSLSARTQHRIGGSSQVFSNNQHSVSLNGNYSSNDNDATSLFGFESRSVGSSADASVNWQFRTGPIAFGTVRYSFSHQKSTNEPFFSNRLDVSGNAGITGNNQDPENWGPPSLSFASGIAGLSDTQYSLNRTQSHNWGLSLQRTWGSHNFTIGGDLRHQRQNLVAQQNARGEFLFNGSVTGYDFADFLLGVPATSAIAFGNADKAYRNWTYDAFVTDDFRVSPTLSLQVGVRWDFEAPVTEGQDRLINLDIAPGFVAAAPVIAADGIGPLTGRHYSDALVDADPFGFQPRFGLAWRPNPVGSVIIRGGYGVYRNTAVYQSLATLMAQQPPLSQTFNSVNSPATPLTLANGFIAPLSSTLNTFAVDPGFRAGFVQRWQASVQYDLPGGMTLANIYTAGKGSNLPQAFMPNTYAPGAANPCPTCPSGFIYLTSHGSSTQHAVQAQLRRRLRSGLTWTTAYTLSKATDNASAFSSSNLGGGAGGSVTGVSVAQDWLNLDAEHGTSSFEQRHLFTVQATYSTGQGAAGGALLTGWKGALVKGWTVSSNLSTGSGLPISPIYRATAVAGVTGTVRGSLTGASLDDIPEGHYANPAAFTAPEPGTWGTAERNSLRGPKTFSLNANINRSFTLTSRSALEWRIEITNLLNRVTYSSIGSLVGSSQFGLPTGTTGMRQIRTNLQWRF